ncbi:MAG: AbrB/MazE/SpoVT family DNA-binding domain-containing protein [Clostridiales bacterium]|jgi:hypothetical protein|nr:AbrB/MazE/SpoVT family DNA-binding domain-containing protein [Clostridiales bacterium]
MEDAKPYSGEVKSRGQLTIPKKIREAGYLDEGQSVTIIPVGDSLLVTPRIIKIEDIRRGSLPFPVLSPAEFLGKFLPDFLRGSS